MRRFQKVLFLLFGTLMFLACCGGRSDAKNHIYHGLENFGFQWKNPSPYADWLPDGESAIYHFGLEGQYGYVAVDFLPLDSFDSIEAAIGEVLGLGLEEYDIINDEYIDRDLRQVHHVIIETSSIPIAQPVRFAMFEFDANRWAVVHGQSTPDSNHRFNPAFDTLLWSLEPYLFDSAEE